MLPSFRRAQLELHVALLLIGFTGLFGKLITASPATIAFGRTAISATAMYLGLRMLRAEHGRIARHAMPGAIISGLLLTLHWLTFFHAIQVSTVAIGLIGLATFPIFITFLEPLLQRSSLRPIDLLSTALVASGLILVAPNADLANATTRGLLWALLSGFIYALVTLLNQHLVKTESAIGLALWQQACVALVLLPVMIYGGTWPDAATWGWLVVLGLACTTLPQILLIHALKFMRAHLVAVATALEPVYGILFAAVLLNEIPDLRTLAGGTIVIGAVVLAMRSHR
ncbi:MAG: DMT family transporter [Gammaproteobacteria bacterium]|jgi:drug/metabolite transporter (DMT)-like permease